MHRAQCLLCIRAMSNPVSRKIITQKWNSRVKSEREPICTKSLVDHFSWMRRYFLAPALAEYAWKYAQNTIPLLLPCCLKSPLSTALNAEYLPLNVKLKHGTLMKWLVLKTCITNSNIDRVHFSPPCLLTIRVLLIISNDSFIQESTTGIAQYSQQIQRLSTRTTFGKRLAEFKIFETTRHMKSIANGEINSFRTKLVQISIYNNHENSINPPIRLWHTALNYQRFS